MSRVIGLRLWERNMPKRAYPDVDEKGNLVTRGMLDIFSGPQGFIWERVLPEDEALDMIAMLEDMGGTTALHTKHPDFMLCNACVDYGIFVVEIELQAWIGVDALNVGVHIETQADIDFLA